MRSYAPVTILLLSAALCADAAVVNGIDIPDQRGDLKLLGAGVLRKGFVFKVYAAALYVDAAVGETH